ncbi:uncharacterized protein BXIN_2077 [Babesia sp. Xinjiang]|uniref:uncharacterized protein n=1 Tax=Babesia sp. Xinjiang TaxID=462227 RepID=UPI000A22F69F|nr:uncharacterized protein BXIN_2077 [Babesia sp. Xinjiang]ORM40254.1 hypothetical protein BXIN_2077 [Babesia sp. Xinjiang]
MLGQSSVEKVDVYVSLFNFESDLRGRNKSIDYRQQRNGASDGASLKQSGIYSPIISEAFGSLRTGDLVFVRYNIEKLKWMDRYKIVAARCLSKNRFYEDVGIVYNYRGKTQVIMLPSLKLDLNDGIANDTLTLGANTRKRYAIFEPQRLIEDLVPDMVTVRRLICDDARRGDLEKVIERLGGASIFTKSSNIMEVVGSLWEPKPFTGKAYSEYRQCLQLTKGYELMMQLEFDAVDLNEGTQNYNNARGANHAGKVRTNTMRHPRSERKSSDIISTADGIEQAHRSCKGFMEGFERSKRQGPMYKRIFNGTHFVTHIYSLSGFIPESEAFSTLDIGQLFDFDFLPSNASQGRTTPRLSEPFHIFNGKLHTNMFENLKECTNVDVLGNRL